MKMIFTIFKKEMRETLRDRRTLLAMILVPLLLIPVIMTGLSFFQQKQTESAEAKTLRVALVSNDNATKLVEQFKVRKDMKIYEEIAPSDFRQLIRDDSLDLAVIIDEHFDAAIQNGKTGEVIVFYNSTEDRVIYNRLHKTIERYNDALLQTRLDSLQVTSAMIQPITTDKQDVYTTSESIGKMVGGFLPYVFVLFCFFGAMYPAIDLFTGEKERGTLETILTTPASRLQILLGKMLVVVTAGVVSGLLTIVGLNIAMRMGTGMPPELLNVVHVILNPSVLLLIVLILIPLTTFFSGILIPASIYAKSFKEAQSLIQPISFLIIMPLVLAMLPTIKLTAVTALVPVLNVGLACKEIIAGTIDYTLLALVFGSLFLFAAVGIFVCMRWFGKEGNILRI